MTKRYYISMFFLCFFVWVILVDNAVLPSQDSLKQDVGVYTRYRIKDWSRGKLDVVSDELLIYAVVKDREQLYYMEYKPHYEASLMRVPEETPVQLRYVHRFPKFWKRHLYDLRINGQSALSYSSYHLQQRQKEIWKITGVIGAVYMFLIVLGMINKPRNK